MVLITLALIIHTYNSGSKMKQTSATYDSKHLPPSIQIWETIRKMNVGEDPPDSVSQLLGHDIDVAGFIILNETVGMEMSEFLLTPISGGCIHVPPPPPNFIVKVVMPPGETQTFVYGPVSVNGVLKLPDNKEDREYYALEMTAHNVSRFKLTEAK